MYSLGFREAAIALYHHAGNMKTVSKILHIGVATIWRWVTHGTAVKQKKCVNLLLSKEILQALKILVENTPSLTQTEMSNRLEIQFSVKFSRQLVSSALKKLGFSRKRLRKRGATKPIVARERFETFQKCYIHHKTLHTSIVSIDEIGFDHRMLPLYGYARKGDKAIMTMHPTNRKRLSMIFAIDSHGKKYHKFVHGTTQSEQFCSFIQELPWAEGTVIILDNASIHKTNDLRKVCAFKKFVTLYTPPYTPECNPIENVFSSIKHSYRKLMFDHTLTAEGIIISTLDKLDVSMFGRCFENTEKYLQHKKAMYKISDTA